MGDDGAVPDAADLHRHTPLVLQSRSAAVLETAEWEKTLDPGVAPGPPGRLPSAAAALGSTRTS